MVLSHLVHILHKPIYVASEAFHVILRPAPHPPEPQNLPPASPTLPPNFQVYSYHSNKKLPWIVANFFVFVKQWFVYAPHPSSLVFAHAAPLRHFGTVLHPMRIRHSGLNTPTLPVIPTGGIFWKIPQLPGSVLQENSIQITDYRRAPRHFPPIRHSSQAHNTPTPPSSRFFGAAKKTGIFKRFKAK